MVTFVQNFNPFAVVAQPAERGPSLRSIVSHQLHRAQFLPPAPKPVSPPPKVEPPQPPPVIAASVRAAAAEPQRVTQAVLIEWFNKYRKPLRSWLRNRKGIPPGDVEDMVQEVFARLLRYGSEVTVDNPQGYLFKIAANVATEWMERSRVKKPHDADWLDDLVMDSHEQPEEICEREERQRSIEAAMKELTTRQHNLLLDHTNNGLTYKEIAKARGLTYRIVLRDLTRAYSRLRQCLPEQSEGRSQTRLRKIITVCDAGRRKQC